MVRWRNSCTHTTFQCLHNTSTTLPQHFFADCTRKLHLGYTFGGFSVAYGLGDLLCFFVFLVLQWFSVCAKPCVRGRDLVFV